MSGTATIEISSAGRKLLRDVNPLASRAVERTAARTRKRDWVRAQIPVESPAYAARQLLRLGAELVVIAPAALSAAVAEEAARVAALYRL
jgi:predicted DNA-binding transcriptional regulator YafY